MRAALRNSYGGFQQVISSLSCKDGDESYLQLGTTGFMQMVEVKIVMRTGRSPVR